MKIQKWWSLPVLVAVALLATFSFAHAGLNDGLVGYWSFDSCDASLVYLK